MPATATRKWIPLPSGLFVSAKRMTKYYRGEDPSIFTLKDAKFITPETFNRQAMSYDVDDIKIMGSDPPIDRLVKVSIARARSDEKIRVMERFPEEYRSDANSFIPTHQEYVDMALATANAKAKGEEPLASFFETLINGPQDVTRDILRFHEELTTGTNAGKYKASLLRFNKDNGVLETVDDNVLIPGQGCILAVDEINGYPVETAEISKEYCTIKNLEIPEIEGCNMRGVLYIDGINHSKPESGEERLVLHYIDSRRGSGFFCMYVTCKRSEGFDFSGALRLRDLKDAT